MKRTFITMMLIALTGVMGVNRTMAVESEDSPTAELKVLSSPQLEGLAKQFIASYSKNGISYAPVSMDDLSSELEFPGRVALLTKYQLGELNLEEYKVSVVGREIFVPIMNSGNPLVSKVKTHGISPDEFANAYSTQSGANWNDIIPEGNAASLNAYRIADASFENYLGDFLDTPEAKLQGRVLSTCEEVLQSVSKDKYGIGFCNLSQLQQLGSINDANISVIPVDLDANNRIDNFERYSGSVEDLARGVWIGKYPASLYSRIYAVHNPRLTGQTETAFIKYMLTDGQQYFNDFGYSALLVNEQESMLAGLEQPAVSPVESESGTTRSTSLLIVAMFIIAGIILVYLVLRSFDIRDKARDKGLIRFSQRNYINDPASLPGGYYFDKSHTWAFMEKDGNLSLGIDNFLPYVTGKINKVQMKQPGERVKKGEQVISLMQNGKKLEIKSPVTGTIKVVNEELLGNAVLLNASPFDEGWLYIIEPTNWQLEMKAFLRKDKYAAWIKEEFSRLKDFMMTALQPLSGKQVVLQEGGEVKEALLENLGPEAWEEFQTGFLNSSD